MEKRAIIECYSERKINLIADEMRRSDGFIQAYKDGNLIAFVPESEVQVAYLSERKNNQIKFEME